MHKILRVKGPVAWARQIGWLGLCGAYALTTWAGGPGDLADTPSVSSKSQQELALATKSEQQPAPSKTEPSKEDNAQVESLLKVFNRYQKTSGLRTEITKVVEQTFTGRKTENHGEMLFAQGKVRLQFKPPENSLLVLDNQFAWLEIRQPQEYGGLIQVTKMNKTQAQKSNSLLALVFGGQEWSRDFKLVKVFEKDPIKKFTLAPKNLQNSDMTEITITIDTKDNKMQTVEFVDHVENRVVYKFNKTRFDVVLADKEFRYSPPQDAEITEY